ncbi:MAG: proline--tRNA ligase [Chloroflexi bacterium]|nr:proline--tRNA ligase [Chloroflexota bacterium]MBM3174635.1 proline--tRNA ligase [Chloroflexota bacterium]MBM4449390.1 proline--tRNA ligase [Chloroflexota bacterium]
MRFSRLFGKTLKEKPSEADSISHQLLLRAGMVQQVAAGVYSYLPLGWRILKKIEQIIREEMDKAGGQELMMPTLQPFELWEQSERYPSFGKTLFTVTDRKEHVLVLGPTHEEVITDLVRRFVQSYRDLPLLLYQIQNKFRDEPRSRGGLLRVREFFMKDLYSFHADEASLDQTYQDMLQAYTNVYNRCGLPSVVVEADSGAIGGKESHEFMLVAETGEDEIIRCPKCGYAANVEKAQMTKPKAESTTPLPLEEIATPNIKTIEEVAKYVGIPASQTLKAVFYYADGQVVFAAIRGDLDINEVKLKNLLRAIDLRLATDIEVKAAGLVAGSASPIGIKEIKVIADDSITMGTNFVAGANKPDTHLKNMNYPRDFQVDLMADIAIVHPGDSCPRCQAKLVSQHGIEVGHVFKLGTFLSEKLGANFLDQNGTARPIIMGCYGIGLGRLLAAAVEQNHDEKGIIWPLSIAPYHIYLCSLQTDNAEVNDTAEKVYNDLIQENLEVLFDDRAESPGVKFNDADLLGIPLRLTVSPRTLQHQSIEVKWRNQKQAQLLPVGKTTSRIKDLLNQPPR